MVVVLIPRQRSSACFVHAGVPVQHGGVGGGVGDVGGGVALWWRWVRVVGVGTCGRLCVLACSCGAWVGLRARSCQRGAVCRCCCASGWRVEQSQVWLPPPRTLAIPHQLLAAASALVFTCGIVGASVCAARGVCTSVLAACAHCRRLSLASGEGWLVGWCRCLLVAWLAASPDSIALITSRGARSGRLRWRR